MTASNPYYQVSDEPQPGTTAKSGQIDAIMNFIQGGFDGVYADMKQCFRTGGRTPGATDMQFTGNDASTANQLIGFDSSGALAALYNALLNPRGAWLTATAYKKGDMVTAGVEQSLYYCTANHTSGTFATDLGNGLWIKVIDNTAAYQASWHPQIITASHTASPGDDLLVDVTAGAITIDLPTSPALANPPVGITHIGGSIGSNNITVATTDGSLIMGQASPMIVSTANASLVLAYSNSTYGWRLIRGT